MTILDCILSSCGQLTVVVGVSSRVSTDGRLMMVPERVLTELDHCWCMQAETIEGGRAPYCMQAVLYYELL